MKRTAFTLLFYDNTASYHKPYISEVYFYGGDFYYYTRDPGSDMLNRIYKEDYASAQAFYELQKQDAMIEIRSE